MDAEEAVGIVSAFDFDKSWVVRSPECLLPVGLEVVTLVHVSAGGRRGGAKGGHGGMDACPTVTAGGHVGGGQSVECGRAVGGHNRQCKSFSHFGIHCRVPDRLDHRGRCTGEAFVEMEADWPVPAG